MDLSSWSPSQYWEARLADNRMVGLFVIENFDETKVHFEYDKREIIVRKKIESISDVKVKTNSLLRILCGLIYAPIMMKCIL